MCKQQEKDYSLLRPFDLEAAKRGERICHPSLESLELVSGPDAAGKYCINCKGHYTFLRDYHIRMAPLAWVEGKPVYKGDMLWNKLHKEKRTILAVEGDSLKSEEGHEATKIDNLTWTQPKVKREIKLLAFIGDQGELRWVREELFANRGLRVASEDKTIEIEY